MTTQLEASIQPKDRDVYRFVYSEDSWTRAKNGLGHGDLRWCFDGQLVYRDNLLCDTYWGLDWKGDGGRYFTLGEALSLGTLSLVCNLHDVEPIKDYDYPLYAEGDAFNLSHQHGCHKYFVKRTGAKKDAERMRAAVEQSVTDARATVKRAISNLECAIERRMQLLPRIEAGEEPSI